MARTTPRALGFLVPRSTLGFSRPRPRVREVAHVASLRFALPSACPADVHVLGPEGRRVRTLVHGHLEAGEHACGWDGLDDAGRRCEAGCYVLRLETGGRLLTSRIVALT